MFRFGNPESLYMLAILPLLLGFYFYSNYRRIQRIKKYGDPELLNQLMPDVSGARMAWKFWLSFVAIALIIFVLARPQFGSKMETVKRSGIETVIALDISNSMLAEDVQPNRLEKSKKLVSKLVDSFTNDKVGMIVFAGQGSKSSEQEDPDEKPASPKDELRKSINTLIWAIGLVVYFVVSFATGGWYITWVIFPIIGAVQGLVKACMDLKEAPNDEN